MLWSIFVTYIITHHRLEGLINGLIAATIGALSVLLSEPTAKTNVIEDITLQLLTQGITCTRSLVSFRQTPLRQVVDDISISFWFCFPSGSFGSPLWPGGI